MGVEKLAARTVESLDPFPAHQHFRGVLGLDEEWVQRARKDNRPLAERLMEIGSQCASLPVVDDRTPDEIVGYDENALPT